MLRRSLFLAALACCLTALTAPAAADDKDGFTDLFNGKDFTGWKFVLNGKEAEPGKTFTIDKGVVIVSGSPNGYMLTDKKYKNFDLSYQWKFARPEKLEDDDKFGGNSGLLVHVQGLPEKGAWPKCIEVQGMNKAHGQIFAIGGAKGTFKFDGDTLKKARNKVGEWNTTEVTSKDGQLTSKVNGKEVASGKGELDEGQLGWQSEGAEIHFKNIKIKPAK